MYVPGHMLVWSGVQGTLNTPVCALGVEHMYAHTFFFFGCVLGGGQLVITNVVSVVSLSALLCNLVRPAAGQLQPGWLYATTWSPHTVCR
jgi:hypothetical protein